MLRHRLVSGLALLSDSMGKYVYYETPYDYSSPAEARNAEFLDVPFTALFCPRHGCVRKARTCSLSSMMRMERWFTLRCWKMLWLLR